MDPMKQIKKKMLAKCYEKTKKHGNRIIENNSNIPTPVHRVVDKVILLT